MVRGGVREPDVAVPVSVRDAAADVGPSVEERDAADVAVELRSDEGEGAREPERDTDADGARGQVAPAEGGGGRGEVGVGREAEDARGEVATAEAHDVEREAPLVEKEMAGDVPGEVRVEEEGVGMSDGSERGAEVGGGGGEEVGFYDSAHDMEFRDPADFSTFNDMTALNYFHLHKTGGVSFKERLFDFFYLHEKLNSRGSKPLVMDTCHVSGNARPALGIEAQWSCDWGEIAKMEERERNKIDVVVGHQYWEKGAGYWLPNRDLRCFTVMRHPLHRKVSFFYHFFVRNAGRQEDAVDTDELIQFVLGNKMPESPLVRDAGPGYYASRLWSDGLTGYNDNHNFVVPEDGAGSMVFNSIRRLRRNFVFIGLQTQEDASLCMLKRTVQEFGKAHGFTNMQGLDQLDRKRERLNTGSYALSGKKLWDKMTEGQREEFKRVERVDLAIYRESVKMFREMVHRFECSHLVVQNDEDHIAL